MSPGAESGIIPDSKRIEQPYMRACASAHDTVTNTPSLHANARPCVHIEAALGKPKMVRVSLTLTRHNESGGASLVSYLACHLQ